MFRTFLFSTRFWRTAGPGAGFELIFVYAACSFVILFPAFPVRMSYLDAFDRDLLVGVPSPAFFDVNTAALRLARNIVIVGVTLYSPRCSLCVLSSLTPRFPLFCAPLSSTLPFQAQDRGRCPGPMTLMPFVPQSLLRFLEIPTPFPKKFFV